MDIKTKVKLILTHEKTGETITIKTTFSEMLNSHPEEYYENLEQPCNSSSCYNESQNFCDCGPEFEDYYITGLEIIKTKTKKCKKGKHNYVSIGYRGNGHDECTVCKKQKKFTG